MIEIIDNEEKFLRISEVWSNLETGPQMRIFQTFDWCWNAWQVCLKQCAQCELHILHWYQEGRNEHVILPCYIDAKGVLRYILDQHSDVLDAVYSSGNVNFHYAFHEMADEILANKKIRFVHLQKMDGCSLALNYFGVFLKGSVVSRDNAYSFLDLAKTENFIDAFSYLKQKDRSRIKALDKKSSGLDFRIFSKVREGAFPKDAILKLRKTLLDSAVRQIAFLPDELLDLMEKMYEVEKCEIPALMFEDSIRALAFRLISGGRIMHWVVLYDDPKLTTELYVRYIIEKLKERDFVFDFGVGVYGYKLGTFRPQTALTYSLRYGKGFIGQIKAIFQTNVRFLKDVVKSYR